MYEVSKDYGSSAPTDHQVGDIISYRIKGRTYSGEILAIRAPAIIEGKHIGLRYVVMRDGANTCSPDIVLASAGIAS